jgi:hypothetical protein
VPCSAHPRGFTDLKLPWSDLVNNDPCGKAIVTTVNGANVTAESLCLAHWGTKRGLAAVRSPIVFEVIP